MQYSNDNMPSWLRYYLYFWLIVLLLAPIVAVVSVLVANYLD